MNISFGRKIPIAQTQILNKQTGNFEPATVFELDCKDDTDVLESMKPQKDWEYARSINQKMCDKYIDLQKGKESNLSFYILQNKDGETIGMAQTEELIKNGHNLSYIDTKKNNGYKYVGQTMLATVAREVLKKDGIRLSVFEPIASAIPFYEKVCGFQNIGGFFMTASKNQLRTFIQRTEERTQSPLINIEG